MTATNNANIMIAAYDARTIVAAGLQVEIEDGVERSSIDNISSFSCRVEYGS